MEALKGQLPADFFDAEKVSLTKSFMSRCMDSELQSLISGTVPPVQVEKISQFRTTLFKFKRQTMQRGLDSCKQILECMIDGLSVPDNGNQVLVVDLYVNRFMEWTEAIWSYQLRLLGGSTGVDWRFLGLILSDPNDDARDPMLLKLSSQIPATLQEKMAVKNPDVEALCQEVTKELNAWNAKWGPVIKDCSARGEAPIASANAASGSSQSAPATGGRVLGRPSFDETESPIDFNKVYTFAEDKICTIESLTQLSAQGPSTTNSDVWILVSADYNLYVANMSDTDIEIGPCELFGFNTGAFSEMSTAKAKLSKEIISFPIVKDSDLIVFTEQGKKQLASLADFICQQAGNNGVMDVNLQDHNLEPMMKDRDGEPQHFRYNVQRKTTSTVLTPKKLEADLDRNNVRGTMIGAAFESCYDKVPKTDVGRLLWED
eukprot:Skav228506  [mRNA]  locus=scaffold1092:429663:433928:- [translate_table: standard]